MQKIYITSLFKFPSLDKDKINEKEKKFISNIIWNKSGDTLAVSFYEEMHIGPCAHSGFFKFFVFDSFFFKEEGEEKGKEMIIKL